MSNFHTISGVVFSIPPRFTEGQPLSTFEAAALNALYASQVIAKLKPLVVKAQRANGTLELGPAEKAALDSALAEIIRKHTFTSMSDFDPVTREAFKMVRQPILNHLKAKGIDPENLPGGKLEEAMEKYLKIHPEILEEAKRRVELGASIADDIL